MRILLIGEYSRLHNSLKEGLQALGKDVVIYGFNDGFKNFPVDFKLEKKWNSGILKKLKLAVLKLTGFDITSYITYRAFLKNQHLFKGFDVVQLINENSFYCTPAHEMKILDIIFRNNKKVFLLSCGDDFQNVRYYFKRPKFKSSIQPFLLGKTKEGFPGVLKFRSQEFKELHEFIYAHINGVIASDVDYHLPLIGNPKYVGMVPNPVNTEKIAFQPVPMTGKINIFLGINTESYFKKGLDYFEKALETIRHRYPGQVDVIITRNKPYSEYITLYNDCHILLDQAFAHDQGYNALEAMAKGKVVFTGAEKEFTEYYKLHQTVTINATPDAADIVQKLEYLIMKPDAIAEIGRNARAFIEKEHDYITIAEKYVKVWSS